MRLAVIFKGPLVRGLVVLDGQVVEAGAYRIGGECVIRRIIGDAPDAVASARKSAVAVISFFMTMLLFDVSLYHCNSITHKIA